MGMCTPTRAPAQCTSATAWALPRMAQPTPLCTSSLAMQVRPSSHLRETLVLLLHRLHCYGSLLVRACYLNRYDTVVHCCSYETTRIAYHAFPFSPDFKLS